LASSIETKDNNMILHSNSMENTILEYCGEYKVAIVEVVRVESNRKCDLYCYTVNLVRKRLRNKPRNYNSLGEFLNSLEC